MLYKSTVFELSSLPFSLSLFFSAGQKILGLAGDRQAHYFPSWNYHFLDVDMLNCILSFCRYFHWLSGPLVDREDKQHKQSLHNWNVQFGPQNFFGHSGMTLITIHDFLSIWSMWWHCSLVKNSNPVSLGHWRLHGHGVVSMTQQFHACKKQAWSGAQR